MIELQKEIDYMFNAWKQIIIPFSNKKYYDLNINYQNIVLEIIDKLKVKFDKNKSLASQLDKPIMLKIIKLAIEAEDEVLIDIIYKRTRASMFRYFHYKYIIMAYVKLNKLDKASDVLQYMLNKNHCAYWYAVYNYNVDMFYEFYEFQQRVVNLKYHAMVKLLANGESIDIKDINFNKLQNIFNDVNSLKNQ